MKNPARVRRKLQEKLHLPGARASEYFALVIFLCDGLLQLNPEAHTTSTRFFALAQRLPMELQMILCHRILDSKRETIVAVDSEAAFKNLAKILFLSPQS